MTVNQVLSRHKFLYKTGGKSIVFYLKRLKDRTICVHRVTRSFSGWPVDAGLVDVAFEENGQRRTCEFTTPAALELAIIYQSLRPVE